MSRHHERACTDRQAERQPCSQQRWQRRARAYVVRERTRSSSEKALWSCYTVLLLYTRRSWGSPDRFPAAHQHQKRQQPRLCAARMAAETSNNAGRWGRGLDAALARVLDRAAMVRFHCCRPSAVLSRSCFIAASLLSSLQEPKGR